MSMRPEISGSENLSRGYRTRQGYGDAIKGLPQFSSDQSYIAGYERGREDAQSAEDNNLTFTNHNSALVNMR